jgi:hypothetical protein
MIDVQLFKTVALDTLPGSVYLTLAPHLDTLLQEFSCHEEGIERADEIRFLAAQDRQNHFNKIRREFDNKNEPGWPAFAREQWPEIETYFNLAPRKPSPPCIGFENLDDELPF